MFQKILQWIREVWSKMFSTQNVKQALNVDVLVSPVMSAAIQLWKDMYEGNSPWLVKDTESLNLPAAIASEIARAVTIEMKATASGSPRADYLNTQLQSVVAKARQMVEYGAAKGGLWFKPYVSGTSLAVDYVQADCAYPVAFDANGNMTAVIFSDQRKVGQYFYTRLEYHALTANGYEIHNVAYKSSDANTLGQQVDLSSVPTWTDIQPEATILNITAPLFGYFRYPLANNIDTTSPLSVSCFSRAQDGKKVKLIQAADEIFSGLRWEFRAGEKAIYVDELAFDKGTDGKPTLPRGQERLYRTLAATGDIGGKQGKLFDEWSPEFREAAYKAGLNDILRQIEFVCGLSYGVLSDPQVQALTATEVKSSMQRYYSTVTDTQKALEVALNQLLYAMDVYATIYNLASAGTFAAVYDFDDSVVTDSDSKFSHDAQTVGMGNMPGYIFLMRNYALDEATAKKWIADKLAETPPVDLFTQGA